MEIIEAAWCISCEAAAYCEVGDVYVRYQQRSRFQFLSINRRILIAAAAAAVRYRRLWRTGSSRWCLCRHGHHGGRTITVIVVARRQWILLGDILSHWCIRRTGYRRLMVHKVGERRVERENWKSYVGRRRDAVDEDFSAYIGRAKRYFRLSITPTSPITSLPLSSRHEACF